MIGAPFEFNLITEKDSGMKWFDKLEIVFVLREQVEFYCINANKIYRIGV